MSRSGIRLGSYLTKNRASAKINGNIIVVTKGDIVKNIDLSELQALLNRLKNNRALHVQKLNGKNKEDYETLLSHVNMLYNTDEYKVLYDEVSKVFSDIPERQLRPGTVGAYCAGCILKNPEKGCSILCNGSLPRPKNTEGLKYCDYPAFWASFDKGKYEFKGLNKHNKNEAIIYLESPMPYALSHAEKANLANLGITKVKLVHSPIGEEYKELSTEFLDLNSIETRSVGGQQMVKEVITPKPEPVKQETPKPFHREAPKAELAQPVIEEKRHDHHGNMQPMPVIAVATSGSVTFISRPLFYLLLLFIVILIAFFAKKFFTK